jgi:5,10-methylenetetrahydromethanopterin reductase
MAQVGLVPASVRQVAEAAEVISYLLARRTDGYEGRYYRVAPGFQLNYTTPSRSPSLMIGGWGQHILNLAGEIADEVKIGGAAGPELPAIARQRIAPGAQARGRDPDEIGVVLGAVTIVDEDRDAAVAEVRRRAATYIPVVGALDPVATRDYPDALAAIGEASNRGDFEAAARAIPDGLLKRFAFAGAPNDVIHQVEAALSGGASRVDFGSPHGLGPIAGIDLIGAKVLPYFRT